MLELKQLPDRTVPKTSKKKTRGKSQATDVPEETPRVADNVPSVTTEPEAATGASLLIRDATKRARTTFSKMFERDGEGRS